MVASYQSKDARFRRRRRRLPARSTLRTARTLLSPSAPSSRLQPPVAPQLPSVSVVSSMRLRYSSDIIWIYIIFALLLIFSSHICGFVKSPTSINGLYCKVSSETSRFVRSVMEFLVGMANRVLRRGRHMTS